MNKYSQYSLRDFESDIIIHQYKEVALPSGLIVPQHINTVSVERQINTETMISMIGQDISYAPVPDRIKIEPRNNGGFAVEPQDAQTFCTQSSQMIANAYRALIFRDVPPTIRFQSAQDAADMTDDDRAMLNAVAQAVHNIINEVDQTPVQFGQYL